MGSQQKTAHLFVFFGNFLYICAEMEKLGYIVSTRKVNDIPDYIVVVGDFNEVKESNLPVLIIGMNNAKTNINGFSVLKKKVNEKLFWTFGKTEKREDYIKDVNLFCSYCVDYATSNLKYYYINPFTLSFSTIKKILHNLVYIGGFSIYMGEEMAYCYKDNKVFGLSFAVLEYCGIVRDRVKRVLEKNGNNEVFFSDRKLGHSLINLIKNKRYATPYFLKTK